MKVEVLIVGGGPGGVSAAYNLAKLGFKVLLVEAKKEVGKPVVCGEYLPEVSEVEEAFGSEGISTLKKAYAHFKRGDVENKTDKITVEADGILKTFNFKGFIIAKDRFLKRLAEEAESYGAIVETRASYVKGFKRGKTHYSIVRAENRVLEVESEVVIGADKYPSTVSRSYGLGGKLKPEDLAYTLSQRLENVEYSEREVYMAFGKKVAPGGYAWIIPRGGRVYNVGLGVLTPYSKRLREYYREYLKKQFFKNSRPNSRIYGKTLPVGGLFNDLVGENVYLVGDAAGSVMPTNGGGIFTAIMCSVVLSEELEKVGGFNREHEIKYKTRVLREIGETLDYGLKLRRAIEKLMEKPTQFKKTFSTAPPSVVRDVIVGKRNLKTKIVLSTVKILTGW